MMIVLLARRTGMADYATLIRPTDLPRDWIAIDGRHGVICRGERVSPGLKTVGDQELCNADYW
jgi:hypothetical protein